MNKFIPVNEPLLDGNEKKYLIECIDSGWISSEGPFVALFEEKFSQKVNRRFGIAVSNGTAAIDVAIEALGIGPGDEVILPTFTIISCVSQIVRSGAIPVLVDSDPITWNMDVSQIRSKITPKTKAIMIVHIYGLPVDVDPVLAVAKEYGLKVIEDAAEVHGQLYRGRPCGSFGDISTFSFYPNKHITTGEGGMVCTNDEGLAQKVRDLRNLCFQPGKRFIHERLGWNLRLTNLQAAIGVAQLERLDEFTKRKQLMGRQYTELLGGISGVQLPLARTDYADNIYWVYGLVLNEDLGINAETAMQKLLDKGVGCRPFFYPMHQQPVMKNKGFFKGESFPVAEHMYKNGFYIPSGIALTEDQIQQVSKKVREVLGT
ncbi:DegT/DnrJ/EryC1/StrS aminotransferase family protein [Polynucleobacter sp. AP-Kaivos-20-H2]|uniref:DegT/DnrJ/EryC1/StrS family aminotransferase n=1 Tax=Polynucleobacter sp. AP-Kaivos-20-H2 TaxID=2689104 RepID=UPI001C0E8D86|nr:DegT/DnrJ/EryC1/StrS family aminotransferase [Polynucleobacter sp. AP-Kaivos-20-H2]MBU3604123.1 DegT/DnrJ/EryC1/StrS family aminotransferase [Polynucleobacter sp. AP-Kaivos-20-H2]